MDGCNLDICIVALALQVENGTGRTWVHLLPVGQLSGRDDHDHTHNEFRMGGRS